MVAFNMSAQTPIPADFFVAQKFVYASCGFDCSLPQVEAKSAEYGACRFVLNGLSICFRVAKITPTKIGQFVTLWKRTGKSPIQPFDLSDSIDFFVVSVRKENVFGQFVFPKFVLFEKGIVSKNGQGGKRAIRVYPPWDKTTSSQAQKTQKWQLEYFLEIPNDRPVDNARLHMLYNFDELQSLT
ncbi:MAG: MepB family protein [Alphaproteobacteria bacterium]